jgi:hypothetical protein
MGRPRCEECKGSDVGKISQGEEVMSEHVSRPGNPFRVPLMVVALTSLVCVFGTVSPMIGVAQQRAAVPDFTIDNKSAWLMVGDELLPPASGPGPVTFDKRYPYVDNARARRTGTQPTYRVADLSNPILKPWVVDEMKKANDWVVAGKVPFRARERCYPAGVPGWVVYTLAEPIYVLQTAKQVTMINQGGPEVRRIFLDVPHSANPKPSWYGESIGHYEGGDTLVVDTVAISTKTFVDNYRTPHTEQLRVIERYKLIDGGNMIEVMMSVDDPGAFTTPWSALQRFRRVPHEWSEDICAENNFDFLQYEVAPLPQAAKPDF